tara:strand:- start:213 stop:443 length:231 start_codon:yes stop_codon:yes gene_type:complete
MYYPSLFESFFSPTRIVVVSEERLKAAELKVKQDELTAVEARIVELNKYKEELVTQVAKLQPSKEPQSLEEALTGE